MASSSLRVFTMSNDIIASHCCASVNYASAKCANSYGQSSAENVYPCCLVTYILHLHAVRPRCFSTASYMMIVRMHITQRKEKVKYLQGINYFLRNGKLLPFSPCGLICIPIFTTLKVHTKIHFLY